MKLTNRSTLVLYRLGIAIAVLAIASCTNERPVYQGAEYYKNLEVPPDLTEPDRADELRVPKPTEEALQRFRDNNKLETVITPKFDGVRMVSYAGNSWIEIDNNVESVWPRLLEFWEQEGMELVQVRPLLGFMETDWTERLGGDKGYFASMFQKFEPDAKDKFRVRLESFDDDRKTRLYVAHTRIERVVRGEYGDEFYWKTLPSNLEAEREIIARMALFAGLGKEQSTALLENYRPYASLIQVDSTNTTALTMKGSMDFVWRRSMRALDRMRMQDIDEHKDSSSINFSVGKISDEALEIDAEDDDLAKSSWLMQLFTGSDDDQPLTSGDKRQYRLEFSDLGGRIQVVVKDARNSQQTDDDGDVYSTAQAEQLRDILVKNLE
ncbi:MAG: outer membrane protein assembly factor BamC [Gammaproteobacteria bacterium]|nr:outer membrane protein assembly factor BamC [Gammaproteobacteria bacterium]NNJ48963.1 outer membrane protein assembly factor BamC [Gammaproteobacteria bacterium]